MFILLRIARNYDMLTDFCYKTITVPVVTASLFVRVMSTSLKFVFCIVFSSFLSVS